VSVLLLVAPSGLGKTTACLRAVELAPARGLRVSGVLSLPVYQDGVKTAIALRDIATGQERILARANHAGEGPRVGIWTFDPASIVWGQQILTSFPPSDLLVIDEIGPLELEMGQGLTNAVDALHRADYRLALVTLRPALVETVTTKLNDLDVSTVTLDEHNRDGQPQAIVNRIHQELRMTVVTGSEIMTALSRVQDPELHRSVVDLGMVRDLSINEGRVMFTLALTIPECPLRDQLVGDARAAVQALPGVKDVTITLGAMTDEERAAALGHAQPEQSKANPFNQVRQVVAIMSGKGGVGKSSVTALLALGLARQGHQVGILDADVTGPSIPKLFGLRAGGVRNGPMGILPTVAAEGIKVMSINLLLPDEDTPVIWRGPMLSGAIQQFWTDVFWDRLDYLLVDLPPGTSDAALTVMQSLPVNGVIMVTTPQELAAMVVRKAVHMIEQLNTPVVGVVENMSYFVCPDTGKRHEIFGPSHVEEVAAIARAPVLARLPIEPELTRLGDSGQIAACDPQDTLKGCGMLADELARSFAAHIPSPSAPVALARQ